jgi:hypothetical protein
MSQYLHHFLRNLSPFILKTLIIVALPEASSLEAFFVSGSHVPNTACFSSAFKS